MAEEVVAVDMNAEVSTDSIAEPVKSDEANATVDSIAVPDKSTTQSPADNQPPAEHVQNGTGNVENGSATEEIPAPEPIEIPHGNGELVLVTGATGYLGSHIIKLLQETGEFRVRGTVRNINDERLPSLRAITEHPAHELELVEADLTKPETWMDAMKGVDYVIHTASPFPLDEPENESELIEPVREGTLNVLKACVEAKTVRRVVLTSSIKSVSAGQTVKDSLTEENWADTDKSIGAYGKSKALAEKAAWDFVNELPAEQKFELAVINPGFIMGPPLIVVESTSIEVVKKLMNRESPTLPKLSYPLVDVRDVALSHVRAMLIKQAAGKRHIVCGPPFWLKDMANILSQEFASKGFNVPTGEAPYVIVWLKSRFDKSIKRILPDVGKVYNYDTKRMKEILQVTPRDGKEVLTEMGHALINLGIVRKLEKVEKKPRRLTFRKAKSTKENADENEEKADAPEKVDEPVCSGSSTSEDARIEDLDVKVNGEHECKGKDSEPEGNEANTANDTLSAPENELKQEEAISADEKATTEETVEDKKNKKKKDEKKEKKEKKKSPLFSFSFKKKQKPNVEKKEEVKPENATEVQEVPATSADTAVEAEVPATSADTAVEAAVTDSAQAECQQSQTTTDEKIPEATTDEKIPEATTDEKIPEATTCGSVAPPADESSTEVTPEAPAPETVEMAVAAEEQKEVVSAEVLQVEPTTVDASEAKSTAAQAIEEHRETPTQATVEPSVNAEPKVEE